MSSRRKNHPPALRARTAEPERTQPPSLSRAGRWLAAGLITATILAYTPALRAPFVLDDRVTIDASAQWSSVAGMPTAGRPLAMATLGANYALNKILGVNQDPDPAGPEKAVGFRLFNLLLHLGVGALLFMVLRRGIRERRIPADWRAIADPIAGLVTGLWLLHPIQSEVIIYIVQRTEAQASLCYLATLYASQRAWDAGDRTRWGWFAAAVLACLLGMLSKEIVITVPLAVMLYDRAFRLDSWRALARPGQGRGFFYVALWLAALVTFGAVAAGARGGSADLNLGITWYGYLYTQCWAIAHYLRLVVWPNALAADYGFRLIRGARGVPGLVLLVTFGVATVAAWLRVERLGWFAFLGSMFFLLLAPSSSVVPVVLEVAAERRIYLALAAVIVLAVVAVEALRRRVAPLVPARSVALGGAAIALVLAVATAERSRTYMSPEALWRATVRAVPENSRALTQLGIALTAPPAPRLAAAESAYVQALAMDSSCQSGCLQYGMLLSNQGRFAAAVPLLERQAAEDAGTRNNVLAARLLALDLMKLGDFARAIPYLEGVAQRAPQMSHLVVLGVAYLSAGRREEAVATFRYMATFDKGNPELQQLSNRLEDGVNHPEALSDIQQFAYRMARNWM